MSVVWAGETADPDHGGVDMSARRIVVLVAAFLGSSVLQISEVRGGQLPLGLQRVTFQTTVGNVEYAAGSLLRSQPVTVRHSLRLDGDAWWGEIMRRLPEDPISEERHYVPFVFEYVNGRP